MVQKIVVESNGFDANSMDCLRDLQMLFPDENVYISDNVMVVEVQDSKDYKDAEDYVSRVLNQTGSSAVVWSWEGWIEG